MLDPAAMRAAAVRVRRNRPRVPLVEAIVLAGGMAERLGDASGGLRSRSSRWAAGRCSRGRSAGSAGRRRARDRSCFGGQEHEFDARLGDLGVEVVCAGEPRAAGARRGHPIRRRVEARDGRRARDERRRARRRRLLGSPRAASRDGRGRDHHRSRSRRRSSAGRPR
jgi:hypothetical protein